MPHVHRFIAEVISGRINLTARRRISVLLLLAAVAALVLLAMHSPEVCDLYATHGRLLAERSGKSLPTDVLLQPTPDNSQKSQSVQPQLVPAEKCDKGTNGDLIVVWVDTAPANVIRRNKIRSTWGSVRQYNGTAIRIIFFLGAVYDAELQSAISSEAFVTGDVVQDQSYVDTYRNLTRKGLSALRWIAAHCRNPLRVVKVDDDTLVNPFNLINFLRAYNDATERQFACDTSVGRPIRSTLSKYYVPYEEFKNDTWPRFCQGYGYVIPSSAVQMLLEAAKVVQLVSMEDVYITGILGQFLGMSHYAMTKEQTTIARYLGNQFQKNIEQGKNFIFVGDAQHLLQYDFFWNVSSANAK